MGKVTEYEGRVSLRRDLKESSGQRRWKVQRPKGRSMLCGSEDLGGQCDHCAVRKGKSEGRPC